MLYGFSNWLEASYVRDVLILIFLENALRLPNRSYIYDCSSVLILIFLENALRPNDERLTL